jgi:two-component system cell cycle sensor histidine kinase/response regulator CckA
MRNDQHAADFSAGDPAEPASKEKRAEESIQRLEEQLRQSQKMEAVGLLAGGVAHDFNNLLTAILGYTELLAAEAGAGSPLHEAIDEIRKAGERAASLTRQLLAFSRKQVLEPRVLDVNVLLENLDRMLRRVIGADIELVTLLGPDIGRVRADAGQIEQVVMNLAVNARDAMPGGGTITIETRDVELDAAYVAGHAVGGAPGGYVMIAVSDTGVGMSAATKARIFEPFFTTKGLGQGTGLGLATVYGIIKQSGGYIWVYSEPGQGTTFKVYLPQVLDETEEPARQAPARAQPVGGSETILLVENDDSVRALAIKVLESCGYTVLPARRGSEALALAERLAFPIHLLLSDLIMPGMGGSELAARLALVRPEARFLFMTGYTNDAISRRGILEQGRNVLHKPFTVTALALSVREALDALPR